MRKPSFSMEKCLFFLHRWHEQRIKFSALAGKEAVTGLTSLFEEFALSLFMRGLIRGVR